MDQLDGKVLVRTTTAETNNQKCHFLDQKDQRREIAKLGGQHGAKVGRVHQES